VLGEALAYGTVLPMRFGVVLEDDASVQRDLLDLHHDTLKQQLSDFKDMIELRVRATYDEDIILREIVTEQPELARRQRKLRTAPADAAYYGRIALGEAVAHAMERKRHLDAIALLDALAPLALASEVGEPGHERVVVNASFLVRKQQIDRFDQAVDGLGRAHADRMRFTYTGPLPPHSFVNLGNRITQATEA
jgi:hypothetical protein